VLLPGAFADSSCMGYRRSQEGARQGSQDREGDARSWVGAMTDVQRNAVLRAAESGALTAQQVSDALGLPLHEVESVFASVAERVAPAFELAASKSLGAVQDAAAAQRALTSKVAERTSSDHPRGLSETQRPRGLAFECALRRRLGRRDRLGR
jgi:hypothetical protein